ncbi:mycothiol-dependent nitroreductase Rv2466c family protein [Rhodococcoides corynebacterioides]|uniref:mycothiol-dependent nitroreductase Rv2466c family protein n=1 Tax=Rhodococcoides corynebacterioides TaxID=53972 RepID=UPI003F81E496
MNIECSIDPACPFAWATSRWLTDVVGRRSDATLTLKQMSLAVLNADTIAAGGMSEQMAHHMTTSRLGGRLLAAALADCGLDEDLADALDDERLDEAVDRAHTDAVERYGEPSGTPLVSIDGRTFFGPVITAVPTGDAADELFDAVVVLARSADFAQLQRPRSGPPVLHR